MHPISRRWWLILWLRVTLNKIIPWSFLLEIPEARGWWRAYWTMGEFSIKPPINQKLITCRFIKFMWWQRLRFRYLELSGGNLVVCHRSGISQSVMGSSWPDALFVALRWSIFSSVGRARHSLLNYYCSALEQVTRKTEADNQVQVVERRPQNQIK